MSVLEQNGNKTKNYNKWSINHIGNVLKECVDTFDVVLNQKQAKVSIVHLNELLDSNNKRKQHVSQQDNGWKTTIMLLHDNTQILRKKQFFVY